MVNSPKPGRKEQKTPKTVEARAPVVEEKVKQVEKHEIHPVVHTERVETQVKQVEQPILEREVKPTIVQTDTTHVQAPTKHEEPSRRFMEQYQKGHEYKSSVHVAPTQKEYVEAPPIYEETVRKRVVEEVQPVIHKETIQPKVVEHIQHMHEKVEEAPTVTKEVRPPIVREARPTLPDYTSPRTTTFPPGHTGYAATKDTGVTGTGGITMGQGNPLIDTMTAISQGEVPSNAQLSATLEKTKMGLAEAETQPEISPVGQKVARDTEAVLDDAQRLLLSKNKGNLIQKFIADSKMAAREAQAEASTLQPATEQVGKRLQMTTYEAITYIRQFIVQLIQSAQFRNLLSDALSLLNEVANREIEKKEREGKLEPLKEVDTSKPVATEAAEKSQQLGQVAKEITREVREGTLPISDQEKERLNRKLNDLLSQISHNENYKKGAYGLLQILDEMENWYNELHQKATEIQADPNRAKYLRRMWADGKELIIRFSGESQVNNCTNSLWHLMETLKDDQEANQLWNDMRKHLRTTLDKPYKLEDQKHQDKLNNLMWRARDILYSEKYRQKVDNVMDSFKVLITAIQNDPYNQKLAQDISTLARGVAIDEQGNLNLGLTAQVLGQMKQLITPVILQQFSNIPIQRIEGKDAKMEYALENVVLSGRELLPDKVHVEAKTKYDTSLRETSLARPDVTQAVVVAKVQNFGISAKNFNFYYKRFSFPSITDTGIADFDVYGAETRLTVKWKLTSVSSGDLTSIRLSIPKVVCYFQHLKLNIKKAEHAMLDRLLNTLFHSVIKRKLEETIEIKLVEALTKVNAQLQQTIQQQIPTGSKVTVESDTGVAQRIASP